MEINERFEITVKWRSEQGQQNLNIPAATFFDHEEYGPAEWGNDLPWRLLKIEEYLSAEDRNYIDLTLRIHDLARGITRVLYYLTILKTKLIVSWVDAAHSGDFEIIADVGDASADCSRTARVDVKSASPVLTQFLSMEFDKVTSLL